MSIFKNFDWQKFLAGLFSAILGALTASAAVVAAPTFIATQL